MIKAIEERRSIRRFRQDEVPVEILEQVLEAARIAPSSRNDQPWEFHVWGPETRQRALSAMEESLRAGMAEDGDESRRRKLAGALHTLRIMKQAPALIAIVRPCESHPYGDIGGFDRVMELLEVMSVGAAVENMILEACAQGLGSLWIGFTFLAYDAICAAADISGQLLGVVALGYADEAPAPRPRKKTDEIVRWKP